MLSRIKKNEPSFFESPNIKRLASHLIFDLVIWLFNLKLWSQKVRYPIPIIQDENLESFFFDILQHFANTLYLPRGSPNCGLKGSREIERRDKNCSFQRNVPLCVCALVRSAESFHWMSRPLPQYPLSNSPWTSFSSWIGSRAYGFVVYEFCADIWISIYWTKCFILICGRIQGYYIVDVIRSKS